LGRVSPRARRLSAELGVDLGRVSGTGPQGSITGDDVRRAAEAAPAGEGPRIVVKAPPADAMRRTIAAAMTRSKQNIPHYYLAHTISLAKALAWLETTNEARPIQARLLPAALLIKAIAKAVRKVPEVNGYHQGDTFQPAEHVHLGVAIALRQGGLIAPALREVDAKPLEQVMTELRDLVARVRQGSLRASELGAATLTFSNVGDRGVDAVYGVIHPPQVALVGAGRIRDVPWVVDGEVVAHPAVDFTLSADHRVSDGARGARFLAEIDRLLQRPETL
jgi:pyruvate dehydrogenase E2 component (dihydrolipoamide acetyltransferase)